MLLSRFNLDPPKKKTSALPPQIICRKVFRSVEEGLVDVRPSVSDDNDVDVESIIKLFSFYPLWLGQKRHKGKLS